MGLIATAHNPDSYSDEQLAEMLLVHAALERGPLFIAAKPAVECADNCELCQVTKDA